jgi:hypothetical protein
MMSNGQLLNQRGRPRKSQKRPNRLMTVVESRLDPGASSPNLGLRPGFKERLPFRSVQPWSFQVGMIANSAISSVTFTATSLLELIVVAVSATQGYGIARSARLRWVEFWVPFQGPGTNTSFAGIVFEGASGTNTGPNDERFATTASTGQSGHLLAFPPSRTLIGAWQNQFSSLELFKLVNIPEGTLINIAYEFVQSLNITTAPTSVVAITGGAAGASGINLPTTALTAIGLNNL